MSSVRVFLDNYCNNNTFYPGQTLTGRVECNFNKDTGLNDIRVQFRGQAETEWTEFEKYYDRDHKEHRSRDVKYRAVELYFNVEYTLFQGGENFKLPCGRHVYPFSYILPTQLPSSFEGTHGNIRYYIKAMVDCPWKLNYEDKLVLTVVSPLDLNYLPALREPLTTSMDKTLCSCCCSGPRELNFSMSLPVMGFVPGQKILIGCNLENMSGVNISSVKFEIVKNLEFVTHHPKTKRKSEETIVAKCAERRIGAHVEKSWTSAVTIPADLQYPNLVPCSIINITYCLKVAVVLPLPHTNLNGRIPIMIGSNPLSEVASFSDGPVQPQIPFLLRSDAPPTERTALL